MVDRPQINIINIVMYIPGRSSTKVTANLSIPLSENAEFNHRIFQPCSYNPCSLTAASICSTLDDISVVMCVIITYHTTL